MKEHWFSIQIMPKVPRIASQISMRETGVSQAFVQFTEWIAVTIGAI